MLRVVIAICFGVASIWGVLVMRAIETGDARLRTTQQCELVGHPDRSIEVARGVWVRGHHWLCRH